MEFWKGKEKKEEEKAARAMIELRKKNAEYEVVSAEVMTSRSKRQELKERIRELEDMLQDCQQQLDTLLKALEEKNCQYDRDVRACEEDLQEKKSCNTSNLELRHSYRTRRQTRTMEAAFNERIERMERIQKELQEQLARSQQETGDLMVRSREESLKQKDQMAKMMEMMSALVKGKGPM
ncbi:golgin subfamily A member 6-like protein 22 [Gossypium hirsutum]|uniref:Golgin subfamily A member 6-like protein 22 n=1 Tax=Gossypium hirsutum TaxID=3635 RepID=A0A1U8NG81_GOSHI|nr:golgin subfamily A member 6-like protein 22 [Gossypium hirsutum]